MFQNNFLKKITSVFLILVFALGIFPKKVFHDLLSTHIDAKCNNNHPDKAKNLSILSSDAGPNCQLDYLILKTPFEPINLSNLFNLNSYLVIQNVIFVKNYLSIKFISIDFRGPPIV